MEEFIIGNVILGAKLRCMCRQKDIIKMCHNAVTVQADVTWLRYIPAINPIINLPVPLNARSNFAT
jgi:hypothetical protein